MSESDDEVRWLQERLRRLVAPPAPPGFRDEVWERFQAADKASARRWRRTSIVLAAVAAAAIAAASVLAATRASVLTNGVIDETLSCQARVLAQRPSIQVGGNVITAKTPVASVDLLTVYRKTAQGLLVPQVAFASTPNSFTVDRTVCRTSKRRVPLAPAGLPANAVVTPTFAGSWGNICVTADRANADRVLVHVRVTVVHGIPSRGELAVRNEETGKPVAYVVWTPTRLASFSLATCIPG